MTTAQRVESLKATADAILMEIQTETALWAANGPKPSYSIDGQSVDWNTWLLRRRQALTELFELIQALQPYQLKTRGY